MRELLPQLLQLVGHPGLLLVGQLQLALGLLHLLQVPRQLLLARLHEPLVLLRERLQLRELPQVLLWLRLGGLALLQVLQLVFQPLAYVAQHGVEVFPRSDS